MIDHPFSGPTNTGWTQLANAPPTLIIAISLSKVIKMLNTQRDADASMCFAINYRIKIDRLSTTTR